MIKGKEIFKSRIKETFSNIYVNFLKTLLKNKRAFIGFIILVGLTLMATVGPVAVPLKLVTDASKAYLPPSLEHPLGTDFAGRDIFQQIVHGSREVLTIAFLTSLYVTLLGSIIGLISGYVGGIVDEGLMALTEVLLTLPNFPIMLMIAVTIRIKDPFTFAAILAVWLWAGLARSVRIQVISLKQREFIEAARILNLGLIHIIFYELMPNILPYIAINFVSTMSAAVTASVGLLYLGVVPFTLTHWGTMLNFATGVSRSMFLPQGIFYVITPIVFITLLQFGAINFAHGLEEIFNPRLKSYE